MEAHLDGGVHLGGGSLPSVAGLGLRREPALAMRVSVRDESQCALGASARGGNQLVVEASLSGGSRRRDESWRHSGSQLLRWKPAPTLALGIAV